MLKKITIDSYVGLFDEEAKELVDLIRDLIKREEFDEIPDRVLKTINISVKEADDAEEEES